MFFCFMLRQIALFVISVSIAFSKQSSVSIAFSKQFRCYLLSIFSAHPFIMFLICAILAFSSGRYF